MKVLNHKGILIPVGGNEDKGANEDYGTDFIEEGILAHVVREGGGADASIVVFPTASSIPYEVGENYTDAFGRLGCSNIEVVHVQSREDAYEDAILESVKNADIVMFSGGDQSRITEYIRGTALHKLLFDRLANDAKFVLAGTSAGAMMMSQEMIAGGSATEAMIKGNVKMREGMGFVPEFIIDSHFVRRGRFGRMAEALAIFPHLMGIGLAEDTGLIIRGGQEFQVIGAGMVLLFDASGLTHNNQKILKEGSAMSLSNLKTHILVNGDCFNFEDKKIQVLPIHEQYI
ncbi:MAG: cyanophycinase [Saprospiraceae bacterium]|nr:cyanophycinase [Saprospiraceae bacterium]